MSHEPQLSEPGDFDLRSSSFLVTGGTTSFGKRFVKHLLEMLSPRRVVVFFRDELKQSEMAQNLSPQTPRSAISSRSRSRTSPRKYLSAGYLDPQDLDLAESLGRVLVSHDVGIMPVWIQQSLEQRRCAGLILVPERLSTRVAIVELLLI